MGHFHLGRLAASAVNEQPCLSIHIHTYFLYERIENEKKKKEKKMIFQIPPLPEKVHSI